MIKLFGKHEDQQAQPQSAPKQIPQLAFTIKSLRESWWDLFVVLLYNSCTDDTDSLLKASGRADELTAAARRIADAAIAEYEDRWAILSRDES